VSVNANALTDGFYSCKLALFVGSTQVATASREFMFVTQQSRIEYRCRPPLACTPCIPQLVACIFAFLHFCIFAFLHFAVFGARVSGRLTAGGGGEGVEVYARDM